MHTTGVKTLEACMDDVWKTVEGDIKVHTENSIALRYHLTPQKPDTSEAEIPLFLIAVMLLEARSLERSSLVCRSSAATF